MSVRGVWVAGLAAFALAVAPPLAFAGAPGWSQPVELAASPNTGGVGIDGDGTVTAVWSTMNTRQAFVATRTAGASSFGPAVDLGTPGSVGPQVLVNEAGATAVVWTQEVQDCGPAMFCPTRVWIRLRPQPSVDFGPAILLTERATDHPSVGMNERGQIVVSWTTVEGAVEAAQGAVGGGMGAARELQPVREGERPWTTSAAIGANGAAIVAWPSISPSIQPPLRVAYCPAGGEFGPAEDASPSGSGGAFGGAPPVIVDSRGEATIAFTTAAGGTSLTARHPSGGFSAPEPLLPSGGVRFALDGAGNEFAYWQAQTTTTYPEQTQSYAMIRRTGGDWGEPYAILPPNVHPDIDLDERGNAIALYVRRGGGPQRLYAATLTRFDVMERPQQLTDAVTSVNQVSVNDAGAAVALVTEYRDPGAPDGGSVALITERPADATPARLSVAAVVRNGRVYMRIRCDEVCRLRASLRPGPRRAGAASRARLVTLRTGHSRRLSIPLGRRMRARVRHGRAIRLQLRAVDAAGNVRTVRRRIAASRG
jgi:hypothetical protein